MRRTQLITTAALVAAFATPASAATYEDLHSQDTRTAAASEASSYQDLRSPDARDAAAHSAEATNYQDLRSPDARDAARDLPSVKVTAPVVEVRDPSSGFDWGDAGIGAAGMLALFAIAAGLMMGTVQSRRRRDPQALAH